MNKELVINWVWGILAVVFILALFRWAGVVGGWIKGLVNRQCVKSHEEQYLQAPMTVNVGGGKYGGGIGVPLGDIEYKTRTACDEYIYPEK